MLSKRKTFVYFIIIAIVLLFIYFLAPNISGLSYNFSEDSTLTKDNDTYAKIDNQIKSEEATYKEERIVSHIETPKEVKALYMSSWVAGTKSLRDQIISIAEETEINALVIDIKDSTGKISFQVQSPELVKEDAVEIRISDIHNLIDLLHSKNIYVIGRIAVFQDPHFIKNHPEDAVKMNSDRSKNWKDKNGLSWVDASSKNAWEYTLSLAKESYDIGFDEINFDYIRFPSDGNMKDIYFPLSDGKIKTDVMRSFYEYLNQNLKPLGIPISADLFGMTATNTDDLGIGQILEDALKNFDFVAPMVYPSHFPPNWNGYNKPATEPYGVIKYSMASAVNKANTIGEPVLKLRPWLQDFNLGATYTKDMVRDQIQATYDVGLNSWMMWDAANTYTKSAFEVN